jgi:hypothetical protein
MPHDFNQLEAFEIIWKLYPDRSGKKEATRHFVASVKTDEDFQNIRKALTNYLKSARVKNGFVMNGKTWFNNWQDWLEPTEHMMNGKTNAVAPKPYTLDLLNANRGKNPLDEIRERQRLHDEEFERRRQQAQEALQK